MVRAGVLLGTWERPPWRTFLYRLPIFNFHTDILACVVINFSHRSSSTGFSFFETIFYHFFFRFTMVIKQFLGGKSAFCDRWASSMSKCSIAVNSNLGNVAFCVETRDAKHLDRCSRRSTRFLPHQLSSDLNRCLLFGNACKWSCLNLKAVSVPTFVKGGPRGFMHFVPLVETFKSSSFRFCQWTRALIIQMWGFLVWEPCHCFISLSLSLFPFYPIATFSVCSPSSNSNAPALSFPCPSFLALLSLHAQFLSDIDACTSGMHTCDDLAVCTDLFGEFNCTCRSGYLGSGQLGACTGKQEQTLCFHMWRISTSSAFSASPVIDQFSA